MHACFSDPERDKSSCIAQVDSKVSGSSSFQLLFIPCHLIPCTAKACSMNIIVARYVIQAAHNASSIFEHCSSSSNNMFAVMVPVICGTAHLLLLAWPALSHKHWQRVSAALAIPAPPPPPAACGMAILRFSSSMHTTPQHHLAAHDFPYSTFQCWQLHH